MTGNKLAPTHLTVIIRDDTPFIHLGDTPAYRRVTVELTTEQRELLGLRWIGSHATGDYYEDISKCFLETPL